MLVAGERNALSSVSGLEPIEPAQRAEWVGLFAERDARRSDDRGCVRDVVAGRIADQRLREAGERFKQRLLFAVEAEKRARE